MKKSKESFPYVPGLMTVGIGASKGGKIRKEY